MIKNSRPSGIITTVAGNGVIAFSADGGAATSASLFNPSGVALDAVANLFVADTSHNRIRKVLLYASNPTLVMDNETATNAGDYEVIVSSPYGSVTSVVASVAVVLPPLAATIGSEGSLEILSSSTPGFAYVLQVVTNLAPPVVWQAVCTNSVTTNRSLNFTDTNVIASPRRFYRLSTWSSSP